MSDDSPPATFEHVDWTDRSRSRTILTPERIVLVFGLTVVSGLVAYDTYVAHVYLIGNWQTDGLDWLLLVGLVVLVSHAGVPALRRRRTFRRVGWRLFRRPAVTLAGVYLGIFVLVGLFGPILYRDPGLQYGLEYLPPVGFSAEFVAVDCPGEVTGDAFDRQCHGSWAYPLGTNHRGHPLGFLLIEGARVALYVVVFTAAFVVPPAIAVGVIAGLRDGLVDDVLMSVVTVQLSIPAIVVYFVGFAVLGPSLLLLLVVFGLFSWGGIARLVRSETLQRRERGHVLVARSLGARKSYLAKRHILPNVTNTVVPAVFHLFAILVLVEAGLAFLGFHELRLYSWGSTISESINAQIGSRLQLRADRPAYQIWWVSGLPALSLTLTITSFKLLGDGLRDALDPRQ
ncbi:ABC transporter permease [Halalkaliarchaeum sp. AArc-GB]|uniref:ABC transporter permease n=1 Tax=Halalkaliarchaeum sp. AArc-GB TaxID=3074078 RepID=UPI0028562689|nr:ABC transporter permease [Halalkaliarchaeum sp. AArc-GB]MDR5673991.1 ABC transporter permease [Halalkaliarchaeum sp. AArc-GB]